MTYENYPPLPEPDGHFENTTHCYYLADNVREAQKQMARKCWKEINEFAEDAEDATQQLALDLAADKLIERFGPFDE